MVPGAWTGRNKSGRWLKAQGQARDCRMPGPASRPKVWTGQIRELRQASSRSIQTLQVEQDHFVREERPAASSFPIRSVEDAAGLPFAGPVSPRLTRSARIASRAESDCSRSSNNTRLCSTRKSGPSSSTRLTGRPAIPARRTTQRSLRCFRSHLGRRRVCGSAVISELQADPNSPKSTASARREGAQMRAALFPEGFNAGGRGRLSAHPSACAGCGRL